MVFLTNVAFNKSSFWQIVLATYQVFDKLCIRQFVFLTEHLSLLCSSKKAIPFRRPSEKKTLLKSTGPEKKFNCKESSFFFFSLKKCTPRIKAIYFRKKRKKSIFRSWHRICSDQPEHQPMPQFRTRPGKPIINRVTITSSANPVNPFSILQRNLYNSWKMWRNFVLYAS